MNSDQNAHEEEWVGAEEGGKCPECGTEGLKLVVDSGAWLVCPKSPYDHFRIANDKEREILSERREVRWEELTEQGLRRRPSPESE